MAGRDSLLTVRVSADDLGRWRAMAARRGVGLSAIVRDLLDLQCAADDDSAWHSSGVVLVLEPEHADEHGPADEDAG